MATKAVQAAKKTKATPQAAQVTKAAGDELEIPEPRLNWMNKSRQWGVRVKPGKKGMTLGSLNVGVYAEIPMVWEDETRNPRGAIGRIGVPPVGYAIRHKTGLWADSAADLYEEAIQRRWAPATDVPWETIAPLPDDVERAVCQICTELSQYANVDIEAITSWQHQMAYGYHEVKQYLATASFDGARHYEVFRKRALANGGGLGLETSGQANRMILESQGGWSEALVYLVLVRGIHLMTMYRYLERYANNEAERVIYQNVMQDKARFVTYGLDHLKFATAHVSEKKNIFATLLAIGDRILGRDLDDPVQREALAIIFGNGIKGARKQGMEIYNRMMRDFLAWHTECCAWLDIPRSSATMPDSLKQYHPDEN